MDRLQRILAKITVGCEPVTTWSAICRSTASLICILPYAGSDNTVSLVYSNKHDSNQLNDWAGRHHLTAATQTTNGFHKIV